ncbi:MAG: thymidylate kinase [Betaproteobacteria bacterium SG8_40]|jgi:dTMP kinase|nr:MAG: thymidylate kinase [Betaproteobacteria bacterium SG8_40]
MANGRFITFEGVDGAGKTTQLEWARQFLEQRGQPLTVTREPGGTELGEALRNVLLNAKRPIHPETEALLMFAARREHIDEVILPALQRGDVVLCDRFTDATFAYQGGGSGVESEKLEALEKWVHADLQPDLTLYFDLPVEIARQRLSGEREADRFERESAEFFQRVRTAYLARARQNPRRINVVDASAAPAAIRKLVENILLSACQ